MPTLSSFYARHPVWSFSVRSDTGGGRARKFVPLSKREGWRRLAALRRWNWRHRAKGSHGKFGKVALDVFEALLDFVDNATGALFPGYATIAERAGCCVRSVGYAIDKLRRAGVLDWDTVCHFDSDNGQLAQDSNRYHLAPAHEWRGYGAMPPAPPPQRDTWGGTTAIDPLQDAADAYARGQPREALRALELGEKESLTDRLAQLARRREQRG